MLQPKERLIEKLNVKDIPELRKKIEELKSEILTLKDSIDLVRPGFFSLVLKSSLN